MKLCLAIILNTYYPIYLHKVLNTSPVSLILVFTKTVVCSTKLLNSFVYFNVASIGLCKVFLINNMKFLKLYKSKCSYKFADTNNIQPKVFNSFAYRCLFLGVYRYTLVKPSTCWPAVLTHAWFLKKLFLYTKSVCIIMYVHAWECVCAPHPQDY